MANRQIGDKYVNKVKIGSVTQMDVTDSTCTTANMLTGTIGYASDGSQITGACAYNNNTANDTVTASSVLETITFHGSSTGSAQQTGTMPNKGEDTITCDATTHTSTDISIPYGYYANGSKTSITGITNVMIAQGTTLFGIQGTHSGGLPTQTKSATPTLSQQTVTPDSGYTLASVTVYQTPVTETVIGQGVTVTVCPDG